jgi:hypothetical protein
MDRRQLLQELERGRKDFKWVSLEGQDLRSLDLSGVHLRQARLGGADLTGTNLTGASLRAIEGADAVWRGVSLAQARGQKGQFQRGDFTGADLTGADLTGAVLDGAVLLGANLTGAILLDCAIAGADFTGANLTGATLAWGPETVATATWTGATLPDGSVVADGVPDLAAIAPGPSQAMQSIEPTPTPDETDGPPDLPDYDRDRPNRYLMSNPWFVVPEAIPKKVAPPRSVVDLVSRLPMPLLAAQGLGYCFWGALLTQMAAPGIMVLPMAISAIAAGIFGGTVAVFAPIVAVLTAVMGLPDALPKLIIAIFSILIFLVTTLVGRFIKPDTTGLQAIAGGILAGGFTMALMLVFLTLFAGGAFFADPLAAAILTLGAIALTVLGVPLWVEMDANGLTRWQRGATAGVIVAVALILGQIMGAL